MTAAPDPAAPGRISLGVHGARGLLAFGVLVYHVVNSGLPSWGLPPLVEEGLRSLKYGVEIFFAISGYVMARSMQRARSPGRFLLNRATRIFPVLWTAVLVVVLLSLISQSRAPAALDPASLVLLTLANLMALPGVFDLPLFLPPAWTLSFEFAFYLLCFAYLALRQRWPGIGWALPLVVVGAVFALHHPRALFFMCGLLVGSGRLPGGPVTAALSRAPGLMLLVFLGVWQAAALPAAPFFEPVWSWSEPRLFVLAALAFAAATLSLNGIAAGQGWFAARFLQSRAMIWLGTISYSLYLWHPVVLAIVKAAMREAGLPAMLGDWSQLVFFGIAAPISLLLGHLSQVWLERRLTERLRRGMTAPPRVPPYARETVVK
ncbi:acyltransferase family protein [Limimaricola hongkongensis]|uniref:Acyltransferase 3 domain-containing protein n=1 Tax=Limimaricola hongkongensis DSM 17492 TaxID=1122180 RepID=A0A017H712_9RHOB|nr:acyltransferase family protein [Limimaricola hongkongensis]EYD70337.1 hypothetical protein Lokhon_00091 [Limimaricola hongkongensis DSM 17492]